MEKEMKEIEKEDEEGEDEKKETEEEEQRKRWKRQSNGEMTATVMHRKMNEVRRKSNE